MNGLRDCPFCNKVNLHLVNSSFSSIKSFYITCHACLAKGPHGCSPEEAIKSWNGEMVELAPYSSNNQGFNDETLK